jgi:hypothetical protein
MQAARLLPSLSEPRRAEKRGASGRWGHRPLPHGDAGKVKSWRKGRKCEARWWIAMSREITKPECEILVRLMRSAISPSFPHQFRGLLLVMIDHELCLARSRSGGDHRPLISPPIRLLASDLLLVPATLVGSPSPRRSLGPTPTKLMLTARGRHRDGRVRHIDRCELDLAHASPLLSPTLPQPL